MVQCGDVVARRMCKKMLSACGKLPNDIYIYERAIVSILAPLPLVKVQSMMRQLKGRTIIPTRGEIILLAQIS